MWLFATPWTVTHQVPLSMGFSRQEYWSGLPFPTPGNFPDPGAEPDLLHCRQTCYHLSHQGRWNLGGGLFFNFVVIQSLSPVWLILIPWTTAPPGFPVLHYLLEFVQTHVLWVSDVNQPSHPLASPSPPSLNLSRHQGLFQWIRSSHQGAKVLELQLQHQSFQWTFRTDFL